MTTLRANRVGSSVVSAITQTPASGPLALVTTPPMSSASMGTGLGHGLRAARLGRAHGEEGADAQGYQQA